VGSLNGLHVQVETAVGWVGANGGVSRVCKWTCLPRAESSDIVRITAETLVFGGSSRVSCEQGGEESYLSLKLQCWLFMICQTISSEAIVRDDILVCLECKNQGCLWSEGRA
jgi:hypothetical protein